MKESLVILLIALVLDLYLGDPVYSLHPVRLIGKLIQWIEHRLEKRKLLNRRGGFILLLLVLLVVLSVYFMLRFLVTSYTLILNIFIVYSCISLQDLIKHGKLVLASLEQNDLEKAREAVQKIIGRDAKTLDSHGVARAAVESLAENFVDGFVAPLFWFAVGCLFAEKIGLIPSLGGVILILIFRATNTLDAMVGYKNDRYLKFGRFSAKLDDILNFIPARLVIPVMTLGAQITRFDSKNAWKIGWRDRLKHTSPNAGHAEACVAGALHIKLNGPGIYPHGKVDKPWLGEGTTEVTALHIKQTTYLVLSSAFITAAFYAVIMVLI